MPERIFDTGSHWLQRLARRPISALSTSKCTIRVNYWEVNIFRDSNLVLRMTLLNLL